jgi:hypothetical protein
VNNARSESTVKSTSASNPALPSAAAAAAATTVSESKPRKQGITVHSSELSHQLSASSIPNDKTSPSTGNSATVTSAKPNEALTVAAPIGQNSSAITTLTAVSKQPSVVSNVNSTQTSSNVASSSTQSAAKSVAAPSSTASKPPTTVYKPKQCNTSAAAAAKPTTTTSAVKSSINKPAPNMPEKQLTAPVSAENAASAKSSIRYLLRHLL